MPLSPSRRTTEASDATLTSRPIRRQPGRAWIGTSNSCFPSLSDGPPLRRQDRDEHVVVPCNLGEIASARRQTGKDAREFPIAGRLDLCRPVGQRAHHRDAPVGRRIGRIEVHNDAAQPESYRARRRGPEGDQPGVDGLAGILQGQADAPLDLANDVPAPKRRARPELPQPGAERELEPWRLPEEGRVLVGDRQRKLVLRRALRAAEPGGSPADGPLVRALDGHLGGEADADGVEHQLVVESDAAAARGQPGQAAQARPVVADTEQVGEVGFASLAGYPGEVLVGVHDRPFRIGQVGVDLVAPVRCVERGLERLRVRHARSTAGGFSPHDGDGDQDDESGKAEQSALAGPPCPFRQCRHQRAPVRLARTKPQNAAKPPSAMWGRLARDTRSPAAGSARRR